MASVNYPTQEKEDLYATVFSELKHLGVKVPKIKKFKNQILKQETSLVEKECKIFGVNLNEQEWISEGDYPLPKFIFLATAYLQKFTNKEIGLFRKAGNIARQRKLRAKLEKGESFQDSDPNDVASLLKQWLRELPEPLIPCYLQDLFIRCLNLSTDKDCVSSCLLTCLLLPPDHLHSLKHLSCFLAGIAVNSNKNRMSTYNLALIIAPNIFVSNEPISKTTNNLVYQHTAVIKTLIENSNKIGEIPSFSFPRLELHSSSDVFDSVSKKKKQRNGTVQDIFSGFKKFVGQNGTPFATKNASEGNLFETSSVPRFASKRKADPDLQFLTPTKKKKQAQSLDDLDTTSLTVTPKFKGLFPTTGKSSSGHARRKSFGALLLRRKEKKQAEKTPQQIELSVFDEKINLSDKKEQKESQDVLEKYKISDVTDTKFNFSNIKTSAANIQEKSNSIKNLSDSMQVSFNNQPLLPSDSSSSSISACSKSSRLHVESKPEFFTYTPTSISKANLLQTLPPQRSALARQEAFSIRATKNNSQTSMEVKRKEDQSKGTSNTRTKGPVRTQVNACSHPQKSSCNVKCDKNKTVTSEKAVSERKSKVGPIARRPNSVRINNRSELPRKETVPLLKVTSQPVLNVVDNSLPISSQDEKNNVVETSAPQSLDLSLSLLFQNFCLSPPIDSQEIKLSIGISSAAKNPELKVDISQKDRTTKQSVAGVKLCKVSEGETAQPKTRKRLSSKSDSRIPRLMKLPTSSRPNSFSDVRSGSRHNFLKAVGGGEVSTKIPVTCVERKPVNITALEQSINNSCFKTPDSSFPSPNSSFFMNETQYLSVLSSPDEEMSNKRESIARILKENSGHVQAKVSLYDSKLQSISSSSCSSAKSDHSENGKLLRASSEKYPPGARHYRAKLSSSSSYNSSIRGGSLRNKSVKSTISPLPKFTLADLDTPSRKCFPLEIRMKNSTQDGSLMLTSPLDPQQDNV